MTLVESKTGGTNLIADILYYARKIGDEIQFEVDDNGVGKDKKRGC